MLSENELIELLDQLKLGALQGVASDADPVGHWPVLIGDGLCLSLQSAARDEFTRQPDKVTVIDGITDCMTLSGVCSQYLQVHHVSTGLHGRSILIGYERNCLALLPQFHEPQQGLDYVDDELGQSSAAYDFSLAVAASLDPAAHLDGVDHPVAFLPLEFDEQTRLAGGWKIRLEHFGQQAEFFIGLLNPLATKNILVRELVPTAAEVLVRPKTLCRLARSSELTVTLTRPDQLVCHFPARTRTYSLGFEQESIIGKVDVVDECHADTESPAIGAEVPDIDLQGIDLPDVDLMVQKSLQLTADDLYLLLVEAIGIGTHLRLRFDPDTQLSGDYDIPADKPLRCLTINDLPIKDACLVYTGGELIITVKE